MQCGIPVAAWEGWEGIAGLLECDAATAVGINAVKVRPDLVGGGSEPFKAQGAMLPTERGAGAAGAAGAAAAASQRLARGVPSLQGQGQTGVSQQISGA